MGSLICLGSLNIDYVYDVERFVSAGETLSAAGMGVFCGGKGLNQSVAAARAGAKTFHAGSIGKEGGMLLDALRGAGVDAGLVREGPGPTGHAIIQVAEDGQNCILVYGGENRSIGPDYIEAALSGFGGGDALLLQNETSGVPFAMELARSKGMRVAFNPSPVDRALASYPLESVDWFILNEIEGEALTGRKEPDAIADALLARYPGCSVVLTLGARGALYRDARTRAAHGVYEVDRVDTTGAGDTFAGYFLAGMMQNLGVEETMRRASVASSIAVSRKGASSSIPTLAEVLSAKLRPARRP